MKKSIYLYSTLIALMTGFYSCQLAEELDDYEPLYSLDAETAITTEEAAELALVGAYAAFTQGGDGGFPRMWLISDIFSGYSAVGSFYLTDPEQQGWMQNNPIPSGASQALEGYTGLYNLVNRTNWLINAVGNLENDIFQVPSRRSEIIAEAKILRALGHFYLLRNFGEFYDLNSEYGVDVRLEPVRSAEAFPRNTVMETYEAILSDLDDGILNGPDLRSKKYTNVTFAKGLKARILLYMGRYEEAAALAKDVIDNSGANFMLEPTYVEIFDGHDSPAIFESSEILFGIAGEDETLIGMAGAYDGFQTIITQKYIDATAGGSLNVDGLEIEIDGTERVEAVFDPNPGYGGYSVTKYGGDYDMFYHMRMAELYLILAEAEARANNSVTPDALNALNTIRLRAGASPTPGDGFTVYPATIGLDQFLTAVRFEKLAELHTEGGEPWYDLVRYAYLDDGFNSGFMVSDVKPTATNSDKFILPIPTESIEAGGYVVDQNPGYTQ